MGRGSPLPGGSLENKEGTWEALGWPQRRMGRHQELPGAESTPTPTTHHWDEAPWGSGSLYSGDLSSRPGLPAECIATHHLPHCTVSALRNGWYEMCERMEGHTCAPWLY